MQTGAYKLEIKQYALYCAKVNIKKIIVYISNYFSSD